MVEYKKGDKIRILSTKAHACIPEGFYKKGEVHTVDGIDDEGNPWFVGDEISNCGWSNHGKWFEKITSIPDTPISPAHYQSHPSGIECITVSEHFGFCLGNVIKYIWRAELKDNALQDLEKAAWYLNREIERRKGEKENG